MSRLLPRSVVLTEAGRSLLPYARQILSAIADAGRSVSALEHEVAGRLSGRLRLPLVVAAAGACLALVPRLTGMPAPAERLRLAVERFGPPSSDQQALLEDPVQARAARLREDFGERPRDSGKCRQRWYRRGSCLGLQHETRK